MCFSRGVGGLSKSSTYKVLQVQGSSVAWYNAPTLVFKVFSDCVLILKIVQQPRDVAAPQDRQGLARLLDCSLCLASASSKRRRRSW